MTYQQFTLVQNNSFIYQSLMQLTETSGVEFSPDAKPAENHRLKPPIRIADKVALQQEYTVKAAISSYNHAQSMKR